jgi:CubicO group peptidase (beta-lactamase class C family)
MGKVVLADSGPGTVPNPSPMALSPGAEIDQLYPAVFLPDQKFHTLALTDRMAAIHLPGISVAMVHDGKISWARGVGVTRKNGPAVTTTTLFQAGSVSKLLTTMAVLHLVQAGTLDLDADVNQYLKTWKIPDNEFTAKRKVTLRMLLSHTGGISSGAEFFTRSKTLPTLAQILRAEKPAGDYKIAVVRQPGTTWRYANGGYDIVQQVLQDVTGQPFAVFMRATVLDPLGMKLSTYEEPLPKARLAEAATGHDESGTAVTDGPYSIPEEAAGGLWTTPSELALVMLNLQQTLAGQSQAVINQAMAKIMVTPGLGDWGLGCRVGGKPGHRYFLHGGDVPGFHTEFLGFQKGDGYVFMSNGASGHDFYDEVRRTLALAHHWPSFQPRTLKPEAKVSLAELKTYAGQYYLEPFGEPFDLFVNNQHLCTRFPGQPERQLLAVDDRTFVSPEFGSELHFFPAAKGEKLRARLIAGGDWHIPVVRVADTDYRRAEPGLKVPPVRPFLDLSKAGTLGQTWLDQGSALTANIEDGQVHYRYDTGPRWGCSNYFFTNLSPIAGSTFCDLRGYDSIQFQAKAPKGFYFSMHLSEAGSDAPTAKHFQFFGGADGESYTFPVLMGTGDWETYKIKLSSRMLRPEWGNQQGNHVIDLEAVAAMEIALGGKQGKGEMWMKGLEFRSN